MNNEQIKPQDLRIDNWINHNLFGICNVLQISKSGEIEISQKVYTSYGFSEHRVVLNGELIPVPLTEDILLKCGFEKTMEYGGITPFFSKDLFYIEHDEVDGYKPYVLVHDPEGMEDSNIYTWIKSLHHLQNYYYFITGQELSINLK